MIYVSCGHEKGVGVETFLKSFLMLSPKERSLFQLVTPEVVLRHNLENLKLEKLFDQIKHYCHFINLKQNPTIDSLIYILEVISEKDILLTLPSSKDQFIYKDKQFSGHTELFRKIYNDQDLLMFFEYKKNCTLLITDHIPLKDVTRVINKEKIKSKIAKFISNIDLFTNDSTFYLSGINPHAGENGSLGIEDQVIKEAITELKDEFKNYNFHGPLSGDTLHTNSGILVYMYHDQGLSAFKQKNYFQGLNITLGLPFLRLSVDHGTAFEMYGKNLVDHMGCYYMLKYSLNRIKYGTK